MFDVFSKAFIGNKMSKLVIGTAQFGLPYGVLNQTGQVPQETVRSILSSAKKLKIDTLDTAISYGNCESVLGSVGIKNFDVITKLPPLDGNDSDIGELIQLKLHNAKKNMLVDNLYCVLMHQPVDLLGRNGKIIANKICELKHSGIISKFGVSIYNPNELEPLISCGIKLDVVQAPLNVFDRRLCNTKWLQKLRDLGIEVHVRSIFLQGLLLAKRDGLPKKFIEWQKYFDAWNEWLECVGLTSLQACANFICSIQGVDKVIVGIENLLQLKSIASAFENPGEIIPPAHLCVKELKLIDPRLWR